MSLASAQKERRELLGNFEFASFGNPAAIRVRDVSPIDKEGCAACNRQVAWQAGYFEDKSVAQRIIVNSTGMVTNELSCLACAIDHDGRPPPDECRRQRGLLLRIPQLLGGVMPISAMSWKRSPMRG